MTDKSELTRNDLAALTILRNMMVRLDAHHTKYEESIKDLKMIISLQHQQLGSNFPFVIPDWEPSLTKTEYAALKAWTDGEDVMLHVLSEPR